MKPGISAKTCCFSASPRTWEACTLRLLPFSNTTDPRCLRTSMARTWVAMETRASRSTRSGSVSRATAHDSRVYPEGR